MPPASQVSSRSLASSWRNTNLKDSRDGSFNRLTETSAGSWGWTNNVAVYGGEEAGGEEHELENTRPVLPSVGIMVKTTVIQTIHERLNYHEELF